MIANIGVRHLYQLILSLLEATIMIKPVKACILHVLLLKRIHIVVGILADWWILSLDEVVLNRNLLIRITLVAFLLCCAILFSTSGLIVVSRKIAVQTLSRVLLLGKHIWWILSLDAGVLNKKLLTRRALKGLILWCALVSRKGGLRRVRRIIAAPTLSRGL